MVTVTPIVEPRGMNRAEAFAKACELWGKDLKPIVGVNAQFPDGPCHVGAKAEYGRYRWRGVGKTWEEAFADVKEWPDGSGPVSETARPIEAKK